LPTAIRQPPGGRVASTTTRTPTSRRPQRPPRSVRRRRRSPALRRARRRSQTIRSKGAGETRPLFVPLEDRHLRVGAEGLLEGGDQLALRDARPGAVEEVRHQVGVGGGGRFELVETLLHLGRVPVRPGRLHPAPLLALELRVDAEDRYLLVVLAHVV